MHSNKTELRDGRGVWTKDSIEIILRGYDIRYSESIDHWESIKELVTCGLTEANFEVLGSGSYIVRFLLEKGTWMCSVRLWRSDEGQIAFKVRDDRYAGVDLIHLWDYIRETW